MFTGLIEHVGVVESIEGGFQGMRFVIRSSPLASHLAIGDSVTIDGACQTVVKTTKDTFAVDAVGDTLLKTTFRAFTRGRRVNLERAMRSDGRMGGHIVMGHVTGTARISSWVPRGEAWQLVLDLDPAWADRIAPEGSLAVDGISLTVAEVMRGGSRARFSVIPHTRTATTLAEKRTGDAVNVELDILASYARAAVQALRRNA